MSERCAYADCPVLIAQSAGKGRARRYCPGHVKAAKRERDRERQRQKRVRQFAELLLRDCCAAAKRENSRRRKCDQCKQWTEFLRDTRTAISAAKQAAATPGFDALMETMAGACRVSTDPDSYMAGYTSGDKANDKWIEEHDPDFLRRERESIGEGKSIPDELDQPKAA